MEYKPGQRVRFVADSLGTIDPAEPRNRFTEHLVKHGDEGEITSYPGQLPEGWLIVRPDAYPNEIVPVHPSMIEVP